MYRIGLLLILFFSVYASAQSSRNFEQRERKTYFFPATELGKMDTSDVDEIYFRALAYYLIGDYSSSDKWLDLVFESSGLSSEVRGSIFILRGRVLRSLGENLESVAMFDSALVVYEGQANKNGVFEVYVDMLEHCRSSGVYDEARNYVTRLNKMARDTAVSPRHIARFLHRKAALWLEVGDSIPQIDEVLLESIRISQEENVPWHEATALLDLGFLYYNTGEEDPIPYYERSEQIRARLGHWRDLSLVQFNIARLYSESGDKERALEKLDELYEDATRSNWPIAVADIWALRSDIYDSQGDYKRALEAHRKYFDLYTGVVEEQVNEQVAEMMAKIGAQTARNDLLRTENEVLLTKEQLKLESTRRQLLLITSLSLLLILSGLFRFYQRSRKTNEVLRDQQKTIATTNHKLEEALAQKDVLYRELHHRVKNNLTTLSGLLYLQSRGLESKEAKKALSETRSRIQSMSLIHQGLYERDDLVRVKLSSYFEELMPNLLSMYGAVAERVKWTVDVGEIELTVEKAMPLAMIVNELVTNSFKYAFNDEVQGELKVLGRKLGRSGWIISIQDNGPGMPEDYDWDKPVSLGLKLVKVMIDEIGASFTYGYVSGFADFSVVYQPTDD